MPSPLLDVADCILESMNDMIDRLGSDSRYTQVSVYVPGSTVGKHVRHILDHFRILLEAVDPEKASVDGIPRVAYDHRRDNAPVEQDRAEGKRMTRHIQAMVRGLEGVPMNRPVEVEAVITAEGDEEFSLPSTLARELWFCTHHAVHHHALIKAVCIEMGVELPEAFGRAPSTSRKERRIE